MTIFYWIFCYTLPAFAAVYVNTRQPVQRTRVLTMHAFVLLSVLLLSTFGARLDWSVQTPFLLAAFLATIFSIYLIGFAAGFAYTISSVIQESCLLLAAVLVAPMVGIVPSAIATSLVFAFAHRADPMETVGHWSKYSLIFLYGVASILLYVWLYQPLLNIALHIAVGAALIHAGVLYPNYRETRPLLQK